MGDEKEKILNGIICFHDIPVGDDGFEENDDVLFLHNLSRCLAAEVQQFACGENISFSYFVSDKQKTEEELTEDLMAQLFGHPSVEVGSYAHPYSDVTPDLSWRHENRFGVGGHDINRELKSHAGKWVFIKMRKTP